MDDAAILTTPARLPSGRPVAGSVDELLVGATVRTAMTSPEDGLSNAQFERVAIDGRSYVVKYLHVDGDWVARATGDVACRPLQVWRSGLFDALPPNIDHATAGCAAGLGRNGWGAALLMHDVRPWLVEGGDGRLDPGQHHRFLGHMAELHATFWGWHDTVGLAPLGNRFLFLSPLTTQAEAARGGNDPVPAAVAPGWERLRALAPAAADVAWRLLDDPSPLLERLAESPQTLVHGDWKAGNLGSHPDGRTILLDWAFPGQAPACADLAWYLAVNCDRLPESKDAAIATYRAALERCGIATRGWWQEQLDLCLLGTFLQLGWSKTGEELAWWAPRVVAAASELW